MRRSTTTLHDSGAIDRQAQRMLRGIPSEELLARIPAAIPEGRRESGSSQQLLDIQFAGRLRRRNRIRASEHRDGIADVPVRIGMPRQRSRSLPGQRQEGGLLHASRSNA